MPADVRDSRTAPAPAQGECRVLFPYSEEHRVIVVAVNDTAYMLTPILAEGLVVGVRFRKECSECSYEVYPLPDGTFRCGCADAVFRRRQCKHAGTVKALRARGQLGF